MKEKYRLSRPDYPLKILGTACKNVPEANTCLRPPFLITGGPGLLQEAFFMLHLLLMRKAVKTCDYLWRCYDAHTQELIQKQHLVSFH